MIDIKNRQNVNALSEDEDEIIIFGSDESDNNMYRHSDRNNLRVMPKTCSDEINVIGNITSGEIPSYYKRMENGISLFRNKYSSELVNSICATAEYLLDKRIIDDDDKVSFWLRLIEEAILDEKIKGY